MKFSEIARYRLVNQQLLEPQFESVKDVVAWMIAMQAQEFAHALWAIGLRLKKSVLHEAVESEFQKGTIIRTHVMRPTWHFVSPQDIRWMLALTAPRVHALNAYWYRKFELSSTLLKRSNTILSTALEGGKHLTRLELKNILAEKKIQADGLRLGYIMMHAELDALICSGPRRGKQFTYALLDERVVTCKPFDREKSLADFTVRYFTTRGPAQLQDFAYWSGLSSKDVKAGVGLSKDKLHREVVDGTEYWMHHAAPRPAPKKSVTFIMPDYDEYGMSYKDRSTLALPAGRRDVTASTENHNHWIIIDGLIGGAWRQTQNGNSLRIEPVYFTMLSAAKKKDVLRAIEEYTSFYGKTVA